MLNDNPNERPIAEKIEYHGAFWDSKKKMEFLTDVAMFMKIKDNPNVSHFVAPLEANSSHVIAGNWITPLASALKRDLQNRTYQSGSVNSLLRYIRNKKTHFMHEKKQEIKDVFGPSEDDVIVYFIQLFPKLILHILDVVVQNNHLFK